MTIEDLREQGVLLPEEEWEAHRLDSTTSEVPLLAAFALAAASLVAAYLGDGGTWTWAGTGGFLACLFAIVWMCDRAIRRQRRRVRRERAERAGGRATGAEAAGRRGAGEEPG